LADLPGQVCDFCETFQRNGATQAGACALAWRKDGLECVVTGCVGARVEIMISSGGKLDKGVPSRDLFVGRGRALEIIKGR